MTRAGSQQNSSRERGRRTAGLVAVIADTFRKYRHDQANLIVSAVSFYLLLTFIPFILLSLSAVGYIVDLTDLDEHFLAYVSQVIPPPYNTQVVDAFSRQFNVVDLTKALSGPLGLLALFFFTSKLFSVLIPGFHLMFGQRPDRFLRGKGKELLYTLFFALLQGLIFFATVLILVVQSKVLSVFSDHSFMRGAMQLFSFLDAVAAYLMFLLLYCLLTPARNEKGVLFATALLSTILWAGGKQLFRYYVAYVGRFDVLFGAYGVFVGSMLWIYYSVFVFVVCAELQAVVLQARGSRLKVRG